MLLKISILTASIGIFLSGCISSQQIDRAQTVSSSIDSTPDSQPYRLELFVIEETADQNDLSNPNGITSMNLEETLARGTISNYISTEWNQGQTSSVNSRSFVIPQMPSEEIGEKLAIDQIQRAGDTISFHFQYFNRPISGWHVGTEHSLVPIVDRFEIESSITTAENILVRFPIDEEPNPTAIYLKVSKVNSN